MKKKLFLFSMLAVCALVFVKMYAIDNATSGHDNGKAVGYSKLLGDAYVGDNPHSRTYDGPTINPNWDFTPVINHYYGSDLAVTFVVNELDTNARTLYDLESNGVIHYIVQDTANAQKMYACFMVDKVGAGAAYPDRRVSVFKSTNGGTSWSYIGNAPSIRSGFPNISILGNGKEIVGSHTLDGGYTSNIFETYIDAVAGSGSFQRLDPLSQTTGDQPIWGYPVGLNNNTIAIIASSQTAAHGFTNTCSNVTPPGTWTGWVDMPNVATAEQYSIAKGYGIVGIVYVNNDGNNPGSEGDIFYASSINGGVSFNTPTKIWDCNFGTDSLGGLRSVDIQYVGSTPKVVFGIGLLDGAGGFFPGGPAKIKCWNGTSISTIDSSLTGLNGSNPVNDVFFKMSRATVGRNASGTLLYCTYVKARNDTDAVGNNFFDCMFTYSTDGGTTWPEKIQVTNTTNTAPFTDTRYTSVAPVNDGNNAYLSFIADAVPASYVNGAAASWAKDMFAKGTIIIGVQNIGTEVPKSYALQQNYPNPFNPTTKIRFELPKSGFVTMKLYDINGREVATLVNEELSAGVKEYEFNASSLASGVYFYRLTANGFSDAKKLILAK